MIRFLLSLFVLNFFAAGAYAQTGIVAVVNDDVISKLDYEQRLAFVKAVGGLDVSKKENKERLLRLMIDERLKRQDAAYYGVSVGKDELQNAVDITMRQNGTTQEEMTKRLKEKGVPFSVLQDQIETDLLFVKTIRKIAGQRSEISEAEIKSRLKEIEERTKEKQYLISEIFLPVDEENNDAAVYGQAVKSAQYSKVASPEKSNQALRSKAWHSNIQRLRRHKTEDCWDGWQNPLWNLQPKKSWR